MSVFTPSTGSLIHVDDHGVIGEHELPLVRPLLVSPTRGDKKNALALDIVPMACLNLGDVLFEFDSSIILPSAAGILSQLPALRRSKVNFKGELPLVSIFGHADPSGDDDYNKTLSGRRARAVFGLLTHNVAIWNELFASPFGGDDWSKKLSLTSLAQSSGLPRSAPRSAVFAAHMAAVCPERLAPVDFLGRGADAGGKGAVQGCGEFNPLLLLSASDIAKLSKDSRDAANLVNRRVVIFLFRPEVSIDAKTWPCPRASEGPAGCRKRFFLDAKQRLTPGPERKRHFGPTDETYGCRFYDRIAGTSPCEQFLRMYKIRLFDTHATPLPRAPFTVDDGKRIITGFADDGAFVTVRDLKVPAAVRVTWRNPNDESQEFALDIHVDVDGDDEEAAKRRLHNLGYERLPTLADNIREFQTEHQKRFPAMAPTGTLDGPTHQALRQVHEECDPTERPRDAAVAPPGPDAPPAAP